MFLQYIASQPKQAPKLSHGEPLVAHAQLAMSQRSVRLSSNRANILIAPWSA